MLMLNNVIYRSLASANIPSRLESSGLYRTDRKYPDGVTMVPWSNGRFLVWDTTCVHLLWLPLTGICQRSGWGSSTYRNWEGKENYANLDQAYQLQPIAVETCGGVGPYSMYFLCDLGRRLKSATREPNSSTYFLQRISVAFQVDNLTSVLGSLPDIDT